MKKPVSKVIFILSFLCAPAVAAEFDGLTCQKVGDAVAVVAVGRDMDATKEEQQSMLPEAESPLKTVMITMIDEMYGNTEISSGAYVTFKVRECEAEKAGKEIGKLSELKPSFIACQTKFGIKSSNELNACIDDVFK